MNAVRAALKILVRDKPGVASIALSIILRSGFSSLTATGVLILLAMAFGRELFFSWWCGWWYVRLESPDTSPLPGSVLQAFYRKKLGMCLRIACFRRFAWDYTLGVVLHSYTPSLVILPPSPAF